MSTIEIPAKDIWEVIEESEKIGTGSWRHGVTETYVARRFSKHYKFTVQYHPEDGLQVYGPVKAVEVRPVQKTITVWEPVSTQPESVADE